MTGLGRYPAVIDEAGVGPALAASRIGRLSLGMTGFAILLLVRQSSGSYAVAGAVSAAYALAFAAPGIAGTKAQVVDAKGDAIGAQKGTDIQSVTFETTRKGGKVSRLIVTMTLDAPAVRTPLLALGHQQRLHAARNGRGRMML